MKEVVERVERGERNWLACHGKVDELLGDDVPESQAIDKPRE